jgi:hypothetical protein
MLAMCSYSVSTNSNSVIPCRRGRRRAAILTLEDISTLDYMLQGLVGGRLDAQRGDGGTGLQRGGKPAIRSHDRDATPLRAFAYTA